jgi:hypothetical protein
MIWSSISIKFINTMVITEMQHTLFLDVDISLVFVVFASPSIHELCTLNYMHSNRKMQQTNHLQLHGKQKN